MITRPFAFRLCGGENGVGLLRQPGASVPGYLLPPTTYRGTCTLPTFTLTNMQVGTLKGSEGDASRDGEDSDSANTIPPPGSLLGTHRYHSNHTTYCHLGGRSACKHRSRYLYIHVPWLRGSAVSHECITTPLHHSDHTTPL